jgi:hypothetical protein
LKKQSKNKLYKKETLKRRLLAAEIFGKMRAMEHLRFTAFITDMAMIACFVWRATRHVFDGTP